MHLLGHQHALTDGATWDPETTPEGRDILRAQIALCLSGFNVFQVQK
jgi:hypothetical protein